MDTSSAAAESITLFAAGGAALHLFTTGQGNIIGNPVVPVLKLTANPRTAQTMPEHIDLDVSRIITDDMTLDEAADLTEDLVARTASGQWAAAEILGHKEFVLTGCTARRERCRRSRPRRHRRGDRRRCLRQGRDRRRAAADRDPGHGRVPRRRARRWS